MKRIERDIDNMKVLSIIEPWTTLIKEVIIIFKNY